jgi:hypothetical protein
MDELPSIGRVLETSAFFIPFAQSLKRALLRSVHHVQSQPEVDIVDFGIAEEPNWFSWCVHALAPSL